MMRWAIAIAFGAVGVAIAFGAVGVSSLANAVGAGLRKAVCIAK
jgi:hypothetical protein